VFTHFYFSIALTDKIHQTIKMPLCVFVIWVNKMVIRHLSSIEVIDGAFLGLLAVLYYQMGYLCPHLFAYGTGLLLLVTFLIVRL
jgi:hypothetical protein